MTGPVGSALADYLVTLPGIEVHAFKRWRSDTRPIAHLLGRITVHEGDIEDPYSVARAVERAAPDRVYHLAAQSYPSESWDAPVVTMRTNVEGTINLLEAVRRYAPRARVHIAGTSAEYGWVRPERRRSANASLPPDPTCSWWHMGTRRRICGLHAINRSCVCRSPLALGEPSMNWQALCRARRRWCNAWGLKMALSPDRATLALATDHDGGAALSMDGAARGARLRCAAR